MTDSRLMRSTTSVLSLVLLLASCGQPGPGDGTGTAGTDRARREPRASPEPPGARARPAPAAAWARPAARARRATRARRAPPGTWARRATRARRAPPAPRARRAMRARPARRAAVRPGRRGHGERGHDRRGGSRRRWRQRSRNGRRDDRHRRRGGNDDRRLRAAHDDADRYRRCGRHEDHVQRQRRLVLVSGRARRRRHQGWQADHWLCRQRRDEDREHRGRGLRPGGGYEDRPDQARQSQRRRSQCAGLQHPAGREVRRDVGHPPHGLQHLLQHLRWLGVGGAEDLRLEDAGLPVGRRYRPT